MFSPAQWLQHLSGRGKRWNTSSALNRKLLLEKMKAQVSVCFGGLPVQNLGSQIVSYSVEVLLVEQCFTYGSVEGGIFQTLKDVGAKGFVLKHWIRTSVLAPSLGHHLPRTEPTDVHEAKNELLLFRRSIRIRWW